MQESTVRCFLYKSLIFKLTHRMGIRFKKVTRMWTPAMKQEKWRSCCVVGGRGEGRGRGEAGRAVFDLLSPRLESH